MQKNKIIHVPRRFVKSEWGGTETVIVETSKELKKAGFEVEIFTSTALNSQKEDNIFGIITRRFPYIYARLGLTRKNRELLDRRGGNVLSFAFLWALLREKNIKLVHLHTGGRLAAMVRLVAKLRGFPYVISIHGGLLEMPEKQMRELVAPTKNSFNWGKIFDLFLNSSKVEKDASAIICVSRKEQELVAAKYPDKKVVYLENGVNIEYFTKGDAKAFKKEYKLENSKIILSVASFNPQKNQTALLEAFEEVYEKHPETKLVFIGAVYDEEYFESLKKQAQKFDDSVIFIPNLPFDSKTLVNAYAACDIFALPSLYEPFGIVVLEAWAAGKAVIASNAGGLKFFVKDNENALVLSPDKPNDISLKLKRLLENPKLSQKISHGGFESVQNYSWNKITDKLIKIYNDL